MSDRPRSRRDDDTTQVVKLEVADARQATKPRRDRCTLTMLVGRHPGSVIAIRDELLIGRGEDVDSQLDDASLSRRHAKISKRGDKWYLEDLGSTNGTWVDGRRLDAAQELKDGDRIQLGKNILFKVDVHDVVEQEAARQVYESAVTDPLTRVHNRRYLDERLVSELAFASRHGTPLSVLLIDVDHFKQVNDTLGHLAGDAVLRVIGGTLHRIVRTEDLVARYGGEEFAVVARGIDARNAMILAERIRKLVASLSIPWEQQTIGVTVSVGVGTVDPERGYERIKELLGAADEALYRAKGAGRNRSFAS